MIGPTREEAEQFALMLSCGAPAREAIRYFLPDEEQSPNFAELQTQKWMADKLVQAAIIKFQGKDWTEMEAEEKLRYAVQKTYLEMAYFLYSRNYVELSGNDKLKADTCRQVLEQKLAGTAGKLSAAEQFMADVVSGRIKLGTTLSGRPSVVAS